VRAKTSSLQREGYANEIVVTGEDAKTGLPLFARWRNAEAFDRTNPECVEVRVTAMVDLGKGQTLEALNDKAAELAMLAAAWPLEVEVELVLHAEIRVGWVMQVQGGAYAGVDQKRFRITAARHRAGEMATVLEGHEMATVLDELELS
jgi:hypothetical protein